MKKILAPIILGAAVGLSAMACQGHTTAANHSVTASQSAMAKADVKALAAKCIPTGATQQLEVASSLKTSSGRTAFMNKCGVPKAHKQAFEASLLSAAESGHLATKAGRTTFFSVTLPKIIEENQG
jgi:predicted membrane-bound mannosyltransferase